MSHFSELIRAQIRILSTIKEALCEITIKNGFFLDVGKVFKWGYKKNLDELERPVIWIRPGDDVRTGQKLSGSTRITDRTLQVFVAAANDGRDLSDEDWEQDEAIRLGGAINDAVLADPKRDGNAIDTENEQFMYFPADEEFAQFDASVVVVFQVKYRHRFADSKETSP